MNPAPDGIADGADEQSLALDMIDVHGAAAAAIVARDNARTAALAGQKPQAKSWIRVLGIIQQRPPGAISVRPGAAHRSAAVADPNLNQG